MHNLFLWVLPVSPLFLLFLPVFFLIPVFNFPHLFFLFYFVFLWFSSILSVYHMAYGSLNWIHLFILAFGYKWQNHYQILQSNEKSRKKYVFKKFRSRCAGYKSSILIELHFQLVSKWSGNFCTILWGSFRYAIDVQSVASEKGVLILADRIQRPRLA